MENIDKMKVIVTGNLCKDRSGYLQSFPIEDEKIRIYDWVESPGGPAATAAVVIAAYSHGDIPFIGAVGNDHAGDFCRKALSGHGINLDHLKIIPEYRTPDGDILVVNRSDEKSTRTIIGWRDEKDQYGPRSLGDVTIAGKYHGILSDGQYPQVTADLIAKHPEAISVLDAGRATSDIINLCHLVNYTICSKQFAQDVTNIQIDTDSLEPVWKKLWKKLDLSDFAGNNLIITLGDKGSYAGGPNYVDIYDKVNAYDTTGAGDIYHGAFMYAILKSKGMEYAMIFATVVAALSTQKKGGIASIPTLEEVEKICTPSFAKTYARK